MLVTTACSSGTETPESATTTDDGAGTDVGAQGASEDGDAERSGDATDLDAATSEADGDTTGDQAGDASTEPATDATEPAGGASDPVTPGDGGTQTGGSDQDADAPTPVPAGTYLYDTDGESQLGANPAKPMAAQTKLVVSAPDGDDVQVQLRDNRDADGYGSANELTYQFSESGVVLLSGVLESTVELFGGPITSTYDLEAKPPSIVGPINPQPGDVSRAHLEGDGIEVDATVTLVRTETITIGGVEIEALVAEVVYDISGDLQGRSEATWWLRGEDLLLLREESTTEATQQGVTYREKQTSVLTSLDPA